MDWFEKLTGFPETSYGDTRAKLKMDGSRLMRERVKSTGGPPGRLKASVVVGDVRQMHRLSVNAGALFQVASQFNLLEMTSPTVTPEDGVTRYQHDPTQGPACAIAAGAATIYRNYFAPVGGGHGQTAERQLDALADLGEALARALSQPVEALWTMQNGYAQCTLLGSTPLLSISGWCRRSKSMFCAANFASGFTVMWKSPMPRGNIGRWSRRPSARRSRYITIPAFRVPTGKHSGRSCCKQRTKPRWRPVY